MDHSSRLDGRRTDDEPAADQLELRLYRSLPAIRSLWRRFENRATGHVFQTYGWANAWLSTVGTSRQIEPRILFAAYPDGRPACLLPFGLREVHGVRTLEWLGAEQADYHAGLFDDGFLGRLADHPERFVQLVRQAIDIMGGIDVVHLIRQPETLGAYPNPVLQLPSFRNANSAHAARFGGDWDSYYRAHRGKGWRRTDRSKLKQLGELGEVTFVTDPGEPQRDRILEALFDQKRDSLSRMGVRDMFGAPGVSEFYRALAAQPWPQGHTHLCALYCGERIAAANLGLLRDDTYYYILHSYDAERFGPLSPGRQLMYEIMRWAADRGINRFDFTIGDESYKDTWCDETLELFDSVLPITMRGHLASLSYRASQGTKRMVKTNRHLWAVAQFMRARLARAR